jgi:hypothetical protein
MVQLTACLWMQCVSPRLVVDIRISVLCLTSILLLKLCLALFFHTLHYYVANANLLTLLSIYCICCSCYMLTLFFLIVVAGRFTVEPATMFSIWRQYTLCSLLQYMLSISIYIYIANSICYLYKYVWWRVGLFYLSERWVDLVIVRELKLWSCHV